VVCTAPAGVRTGLRTDSPIKPVITHSPW
jgi:hypothetical protein